MLELTRLHLRKDRLIFLALSATVVLSMPLALAITSKEVTARQALDATWMFWFLVGLPGFAVLFGAASGAELASDAARANENLLPVSPARRAWAAALTSSVHLAALAALLALLGVVIGCDWSRAAASPFRWFDAWEPSGVAPFAGLFALCLPVFLLLSLLGAYVSRNGVLGAILGGVFGGACVGTMGASVALHMLEPYRTWFPWLWPIPAWLLAVAGAATALTQAAARLERKRRTGWGAVAGIAASALGGILLAGGILWWNVQRLPQATRLLEPSHSGDFRLPGLAGWSKPGGVLLQSMGGDLIWATPDGTRKTLLAGNGSFFTHQLDRAAGQWDAGGALWVLAMTSRTPLAFDLLTGTPEDGLKQVSHFVPSGFVWFLRHGDELGVWSYYDGYAALPLPGRQPAWEKTSKGSSELEVASALRAGTAARFDRRHGTVMLRLPGGRTRAWQVSKPESPSPAKLSPYAPETLAGVTIGGRLVFPAAVRSKEGWALKLCEPNGSVRVAWTQADELGALPEKIPTGGLWGFVAGHRAIRWVSPTGDAFGPASLIGIGHSDLHAVRADGRKLWLVANDTLYVIGHGSGKPVAAVALPPLAGEHRWPEGRLKAIDQGFFWHTGSALYFVDWDGNVRALGR